MAINTLRLKNLTLTTPRFLQAQGNKKSGLAIKRAIRITMVITTMYEY